ncbi:MAG: hypothetical protein GY782_09485 [Gammaproteobacteria bacterium]|nr:hypothetical protein [Gammaproteobacteria bacterium]
MKTEHLTDCALANIKKVHKMTEKQLNKSICLPCGCGGLVMADLLENYTCDCEIDYYYSFCEKEVFDCGSFWHCNDCRSCSEDGEWHCKKCGNCTFGNTLPCESCGAKSPYAPPFD